MAVSKVVLGNQTVMDITDSTVDAGSLLAGKKAYGANGEAVNGSLVVSDRIRWSEAKTSVKKNLLSSEIVSQTQNDLTFTVNADKSITVSGTASAVTVIIVGYIDVKAGVQYKLTGGVVSDHTHLDLRKDNVTWTANTSGKAVISPKPSYGIDTFVPNSDDTLACCIRIANGEDLTTPITFYPMIRLSTIEDDTYVPYIPDNVELDEKKVGWEEQNVLGAKNLFHFLDKNYKGNNTVGTWSSNEYTLYGITFTVNSDGTITANGTATADATIYLLYNDTNSGIQSNIEYVLSGCPNDGGSNKYLVQIWNQTRSSGVNDYGSECKFTIPSSNDQITILARVKNGQTVSNLVFKPMIRLASIKDSTYEPYAKTNKQLTDDISSKANKSGDTFTGQIRTSFKASVAPGCYQAASVTIPDLCDELRYSSGCMGSVNINTAYTKLGVTIEIGWYNYMWIPHRTGGVNGQAAGDNTNYGMLILSKMVGADSLVTPVFIVRFTSGSICEIKRIAREVYFEQTATTSTTTDTVYTFTNNAFTIDSVVDVYADIFGVSPSNVVVSAGTCTVTFPKQDTAQSMTCRIYIK